KETANGFRRLGSATEPIIHPIALEQQFRGIAPGVVVTQNLDKTAVPSPLSLDHHDPVAAFLLGSSSSQSYFEQTDLLLRESEITNQKSGVRSQNVTADFSCSDSWLLTPDFCFLISGF